MHYRFKPVWNLGQYAEANMHKQIVLIVLLNMKQDGWGQSQKMAYIFGHIKKDLDHWDTSKSFL